MTQSGGFAPHPIEWTGEKVSRLWNYYSKTPPYRDMYFAKLLGDRILARAGLPLDQELQVLDFGCGPGFLWDHLVTMGARWRYTGLEFSRDSIDEVMRKAAGRPGFEHAEYVATLPSSLEAERFDVVFLVEVVEHLNDRYLAGAFVEATRLLKRGGVLVVTTPNEEDMAASETLCPDCGAVFHKWQHVRTWSVGSLSAYGRSCGLILRRCTALDFGAHGLVSRGARLARKLLGRKVDPHLMALFQKA